MGIDRRMTVEASTRAAVAWVCLLACWLCASCHGKTEPDAQPSRSALAKGGVSKPVDRLAPDELAAGNAVVWGFVIPREMQVEHRYKGITHLVGQVTPDALANYVRERVVVSHVEIGAARTIFPQARIKSGDADRVYDLEVIAEPGITRLVIRDSTPPKILPGLSDAERWRQAGLTPEGRPLDPKAFE
jgi:hypothetical protein